jgi:hypothetical protein
MKYQKREEKRKCERSEGTMPPSKDILDCQAQIRGQNSGEALDEKQTEQNREDPRIGLADAQ